MAEKTEKGTRVNSRIKTLDRGTITINDHKYFSEIKTKLLEDGGYVLSFVTSSLQYYNQWLIRTGATYVDDIKESRRLDIESAVGDSRDRIADNFKFTAFLVMAVVDMYRIMTKTEKDKLSPDIKEGLELLLNKRENGSQFQLETKKNLTEELSKLIDREHEIAEIFTKPVIGE
jgi:hypothetical protein